MSLSSLVNRPFNKSSIKIALIGLGLHAQRIYYPLFRDYAEKLNVELSLVVDLESSKSSINEFIRTQHYHPKELVYLPNDLCKPSTCYINKEIEGHMRDTMKRLQIDGAIISTEPLAHKMYANFCLEQNLHILMDKPITTLIDSISSIQSARMIYQDFEDLKQNYIKAKSKNKDLSFSIVAQRRFHPAYYKIKELVNEISQRVNIPITSIHSYHSDGEWRLPHEIAGQGYHSYNEGYGKLSHSGYHSIDIMSWLVQSSYENCWDKKFDRVTVGSTFVKPSDFLQQFTHDDFRNLFGEEQYNEYNRYHGNDEELRRVLKGCGEIDGFLQVNFQDSDGSILTTATLNLQHNGFSNRSWLSNRGRNLYKGNGRVRHESHIIQQGPFQSIHIDAFQSKFDPSESDDTRYDVGGVDHLDVTVYRNPLVATDDVGTFEHMSIKDLAVEFMSGYSRGHQESSRALSFFEFINNVHGNQDNIRESKSNILSHQLTVGVISAAYQSHCLQRNVSLENREDGVFFTEPN